jgi:hypothetical protein
MKLSENTINILKNFSTINPSILVKEGNTISTISQQKSIFARANVEETFPKQFAIYELSKFLGVLSLFKDAEIELGSKQMTIKAGKQSLNYTYADPSMIIVPPEKDITLPAPDIEFDITQEELQKVVRATSVLQLPDISVVGNGSVIQLCAINSKNPTTDTFTIDVGTTNSNFNMVFKADNIIKLLMANYNVKISSKGLALFTSDNISYYVAIEKNNSSFNK